MIQRVRSRTTAPWYFRFAKLLDRHGLRGGYRLAGLAERLGGLNCVVRYPLSHGVTLAVPLYRESNRWARPDLVAYERPLVAQLASAIGALPQPVRWVDCGADIGTVTALVAAQCGELAEALALEPNPEAFVLLAENIRQLPFPAAARRAAVASFTGRGALAASPTDPFSDHAKFLTPASDGAIDVVRIDDLKLAAVGGLAMKIDVEGGELDVLRGAAATLARVTQFVVAFEAHRDVCARTGIDPTQCLRFLQSLRPCTWLVAEAPAVTIDSTRAYFDQVPEQLRISNVVCRTMADDVKPMIEAHQ